MKVFVRTNDSILFLATCVDELPQKYSDYSGNPEFNYEEVSWLQPSREQLLLQKVEELESCMIDLEKENKKLKKQLSR